MNFRVSEIDAYELIHGEIIASELSPGERLVEEELAERLGTTRGPVRAALVRLSHEGLVVRERNRGAHVRRINVEEAIEILEARSVLESLAAGYAAVRRTDAEIEELERLVAEMRGLQADGELLEVSTRNGLLHRRILEISGHQVAQEVCARLHSQVVRFQFRTVLAPGRSARSVAEHTSIVEAIRAGDREAAEAAMRGHLAQVTGVLVDLSSRERQAS
jgi:DNA-binding GntR family transcriptional regulator